MRPSQPLRVARLPGLPEGFEELAADALADGHRILEVLRADWDSGALRFERPGEALFAAFAGSALLGICGLTPDPYLKGEQAGRLRRLYVRRAARGHGAGRALLDAVAARRGARAGRACASARRPRPSPSTKPAASCAR